jgi:hypothetical protein
MTQRAPSQRIRSIVMSGGVLAGMLFYVTYVYAHSTGITGVTKKNGEGCICHNPTPTSSVIVTINGPAELIAGQSAHYTVTVQGGPAVRAGTNIAASDGTIDPVSFELQKIGDELTHTSPQTFENGVATFNFSYTAPTTPGVYTIFANGNSVNFNGINTGDQWNFAPDLQVTVRSSIATSVGGTSALPGEFGLSQNYPNPFNPSTTISYAVARTSRVSLDVYDMAGRLVQNLVSGVREPGHYSANFNASGLASGVYFYRLSADGALVQTKKLALIK